MLQVAAYCRVSTDKEDQANSFESQQRYFREYIQRQPDWELQGIYADEGFSGTSTNKRVEFNKMLHAAELGQIDLIVTKEVSRFTRNTVDALQITREGCVGAASACCFSMTAWIPAPTMGSCG